ncbi:MAG: hypothetical protein KAW41_02560 [Candidatus Diapherotrites archaeon]|nr:hypothetical protein [Candidatus Diapherotrites archaeon]
MSTVVTTVRLPARVKQEAESLVHKGLFKNFSDVVLAGLRREINAHTAREAREQVWRDYLERSGGDAEKASRLYLRDAEEYQKKHPGLFK